MNFCTQWNICQMKGEDLGLHFLLVFWMDIHYALQIQHSKSLFWFLATSVFFTIQTCVQITKKSAPSALCCGTPITVPCISISILSWVLLTIYCASPHKISSLVLCTKQIIIIVYLHKDRYKLLGTRLYIWNLLQKIYHFRFLHYFPRIPMWHPYHRHHPRPYFLLQNRACQLELPTDTNFKIKKEY